MTIQKLLKSSLISRSFIASIDQAAVSGLSFLISIILIKYAPKAQFGYYSIGNAVLLFFTSVQQAIITTPLAVLLVEKKGNEKNRYAASLCYGQFVIIIPTVCLGLTATALLAFGGFDSTKAWIAASVCFTVIGLILRQFIRSYWFAEEKPLTVFKIDVAYIVLLLCSIAVTYLFFKISVAAIFVLMGISALTIGLFFGRTQGWRFNQGWIKKSYRENWKYGKWALFGGLVTYIQNYSYLYLLGALLGSMEVAEVSASRLLITPLILFRAGWVPIILPYGSKLRERGQIKNFFKMQVVISLLYALIVLCYCIILISFSGVLQKLIFTQEYVHSFNYLFYWAAINITGFVGLNAACGLQVAKNFEILFKVSVLCMLVTLACAFWLITTHGIKGGLLALVIGNLSGAVLLWCYYVREIFFKLAYGPKMSKKSILIPNPQKEN